MDSEIIVWDLRTFSFVKSISSTHAEPICQLLLSPKAYCVISTSSRLLVCWDCYIPHLVSTSQTDAIKEQT